MAEGETQYNIPVSSKQLIVYFVFLVIALSAAFLAGVMVGRNVDSSPEPTVRDIQEAGIPEEPAASPTPDALTYGSTLQGEKVEGLASAAAPPAPAAVSKATPPAAAPPAPAAVSKATPPAAVHKATAPVHSPSPVAKAPEKATQKPAAKTPATPRASATPKATPKTGKAAPAGKATPAPKAPPAPLNRLSIQVGAFKERAAAEDIVKRLKAKGYSAYLVPASEGLFNVRVGSFTDREDAERVLTKLETQEKFKPFIVKP